MKSPDNDFCLDKGICIQYANLNEQKDKVDGWVNCSIFSNEQKIRQRRLDKSKTICGAKNFEFLKVMGILATCLTKCL